MLVGDEVRSGMANKVRLESESLVVFALCVAFRLVAIKTGVAIGAGFAGHGVIEAGHLATVASRSLLVFSHLGHSFVDGCGRFFGVDLLDELVVFAVDAIPSGAGFIWPKVYRWVFFLCGLSLLELGSEFLDLVGELCCLVSFFCDCYHCFTDPVFGWWWLDPLKIDGASLLLGC